MEHLLSTIKNGLSDVDETKGLVRFYFANFNTPDSHKRMMHKNAFNRTFNNNFKRFHHLLNHNPNIILGKPQEVGTDEKGAWMVSKLSHATAGRDALIQYAEKIYNEHSFMFRIVKSHMNGSIEVVEELQMFEASTVTWGVHANTPTISLNSMSGTNDIILAKLNQLLALKDSPISEPTDNEVKNALNLINNFKY